MAYVSDITKAEYSKGEFLAMLEKRVRKHLRIDGKLDTKQHYVLLEEDHVANKLLQHILTAIFSDRLQLRVLQNLSERQTNEIILSSEYLESYIDARLEVFFAQKSIQELTDILAPLRVLSAKEINSAAELLKLTGTPAKEASIFIEKLQEKYPQTKTSLLKSFDFMAKEIITKE